MLQKLHISNVALIQNLEIEFDANFNVLSGETGAGKSIIIDSIFLLLGEKYDKSLLKHGQQCGFVEGVFEIGKNTKVVLQELGFVQDDMVIVRRRFKQDGKNEIKVNGQNCTPSMLKRIMTTLVDIYGQNQHLTLSNKSEQLQLITDFLGDSTNELQCDIANLYSELKNINRQIADLGDSSKRLRELEILQFQIQEIENAKILQNEEQSLTDKRKLILSSEKIKATLTRLTQIISSGEINILHLFGECKTQLNSIKTVEIYQGLINRMENCRLELMDISGTLYQNLQEVDFDSAEIDALEKRLELVRTIKRKYGDTNQMHDFLLQAKSRLGILSNADSIACTLKSAKQKCMQSLYQKCTDLSNFRRSAAVELSKKIVLELAQLGMKDSVFEVIFSDIPEFDVAERKFSNDGFDSVEFYLSTNLGQPIKPLSKIISGGEISRFMLGLKVIAATVEQIDTLIFDEIDAGISGIIGQAVAQKMAQISRTKQVLCISHLPQIAAMADANFLIEKNTVENSTVTTVTRLDDVRTIEEIARLTGGINISKQSAFTAQEMIDWCNKYKSNLSQI
ncbi:MAG: DNA repair protein RecN [Clostridiales bacterium]|jgi:DNA repair protein RecN (Recombination protein N)|nr:DNA repair protein RecN [Clostridiales bacterium]